VFWRSLLARSHDCRSEEGSKADKAPSGARTVCAVFGTYEALCVALKVHQQGTQMILKELDYLIAVEDAVKEMVEIRFSQVPSGS
jgi:hypothetical protein